MAVDRTDVIMQIVDERAGYYRSNPHRFVEEYLNVKLKWFQKILIFEMMESDRFMYIASRGQGKTYLTAIFACVRCLLYPGTGVVVCSSTYKQGRELVLKITDKLCHNSSLLRSEIEASSTGQNDCYVKFKSGSIIRVVTPTDSARGGRSHVLIIDESRLLTQKTVEEILRPFNSDPRHPGYLDKPEYSHLLEMNKEIYLSSAWYQASELYDKAKAYTANFLDDNMNYFICDLPYQLSIKEGLLMREQIQADMSEATFSDISFMMEREGLFYGSTEDALFDFTLLNSRRVIVECLHDLDYYRQMNLKIPEKQDEELRVLSVDVALLGSKRHDNDASALIIHSAVPTASYNYLDNIVYIDTQEGLMTDDLGLLVMRYYYQFGCDYIALDANGVGQSILDFMMSDRYDPLYGQQYGALDCYNNPDLSARCKVKNAPKVIWAIKASNKLNNDMCLALRAGFQNGYINLLINDEDVDTKISKVRGYTKLTEQQQSRLRLPYVQTTFLIDELINLQHDTSGGTIKVKEKSGMRKDRYSSLEYGYYVVQQLGQNLKPKGNEIEDLINRITIRPSRKVKRFG